MEDKHATIDDITVFVVPLKNYKLEYELWLKEAKFSCSLSHSLALEQSIFTSNSTSNITNTSSSSASSSILLSPSLVEPALEAAHSTTRIHHNDASINNDVLHIPSPMEASNKSDVLHIPSPMEATNNSDVPHLSSHMEVGNSSLINHPLIASGDDIEESSLSLHSPRIRPNEEDGPHNCPPTPEPLNNGVLEERPPSSLVEILEDPLNSCIAPMEDYFEDCPQDDTG